MDTIVEGLVNTKAVSLCEHSKGEFISPVFLVPKSDGSRRFILNLKQLNECIINSHFKMEDLRTARKLISRNASMATVDLKDAYFHVPIHDESKKLLRFLWNDQLYEFNCLPFGLCTAPRIFTKILKPVFNRLRSLGYVSVVYLDDILLIGYSRSECQNNVNFTVSFLQSLGFTINFDKSVLIPTYKLQYLGFILDSQDYTVRLTNKKIEKIVHMSNFILSVKTCKILDFAKLIGLFISACPAVPYGFLYTKILESHKFLALQRSKGSYRAYIVITDDIKNDIIWWLGSVKHSHAPIYENNYDFVIFTDASKIGWGASSTKSSTNGWWNAEEQKCSINYLELLAIYNSLLSIARDFRNCRILLRADNTTAISYINRMGSVQFQDLNLLARKIWQWCEKRNIYLFASYIKSKDNVHADFESRRLHDNSEWELNGEIFNSIIASLSYEVSTDLFASYQNHKCESYFSWRPDPQSSGIDAFTFSWSNLRFYAFPPFSMILQTLRKIESDNATGIVVAPFWPTQPWFPFFRKLCDNNFIIIEPSKDLLTFCNRPHPLWKTISLVAGLLSRKHC